MLVRSIIFIIHKSTRWKMKMIEGERAGMGDAKGANTPLDKVGGVLLLEWKLKFYKDSISKKDNFLLF